MWGKERLSWKKQYSEELNIGENKIFTSATNITCCSYQEFNFANKFKHALSPPPSIFRGTFCPPQVLGYPAFRSQGRRLVCLLFTGVKSCAKFNPILEGPPPMIFLTVAPWKIVQRQGLCVKSIHNNCNLSLIICGMCLSLNIMSLWPTLFSHFSTFFLN